MSWFNAAAAGNTSVAVTYRRGATQVAWNATVDKTQFESDLDGQDSDAWTSRDYSGAVSELTAGGITMPPLAGDRVVEQLGSQSVTHELMQLAGAQPYEYEDSGALRVRVHTKEISRV